MIALESIYKNEEVWLKHIGCTITNDAQGIKVVNLHNQSSDFNYFLPNKGTKISEINHTTLKIRYSDLSKDLNTDSDFGFNECFSGISKSNYKEKATYDIQLVLDRTSAGVTTAEVEQIKIKDEYKINEYLSLFKTTAKEVALFNVDSLDQYRDFSVGNFNFFFILFNGMFAGRINLLAESGVFGIYDFEIDKDHQKRGIGKSVLSFVVNDLLKDKSCFIQTWKENEHALTLYRSLGFREIDYYYYFTKRVVL